MECLAYDIISYRLRSTYGAGQERWIIRILMCISVGVRL